MIPPRWLLRVGWAIHRTLFRVSGGRVGTERPKRGRVGTLFLTTIGRKSGQPRRTALSYLEDGSNFVVVASNAGADEDPRWWRNLQANAAAEVSIDGKDVSVRARLATPEERQVLWPRLVAASPPYAEYERRAARPIPVVLLEPPGV